MPGKLHLRRCRTRTGTNQRRNGRTLPLPFAPTTTLILSLNGSMTSWSLYDLKPSIITCLINIGQPVFPGGLTQDASKFGLRVQISRHAPSGCTDAQGGSTRVFYVPCYEFRPVRHEPLNNLWRRSTSRNFKLGPPENLAPWPNAGARDEDERQDLEGSRDRGRGRACMTAHC